MLSSQMNIYDKPSSQMMHCMFGTPVWTQLKEMNLNECLNDRTSVRLEVTWNVSASSNETMSQSMIVWESMSRNANVSVRISLIVNPSGCNNYEYVYKFECEIKFKYE